MALRHLAELAAGSQEPDEVLTAVAVEASALLNGSPMTVVRLEEDGAQAVIVAVSNAHAPLGLRFPVSGDNLASRIRRSCQPERVDDFSTVTATNPSRELGVRAAVAVPITVNGQLWGMLGATSNSEPLPSGTERRLAQFAGIVAAAISSSQARSELKQLVAEQAALLRVAELVARGADEKQVFDTVAREAAGLVNNEGTTLVRMVAARSFVIVATCGGPAPVGMQVDVPEDDQGSVAELLRTHRTARLDNYHIVAGPSFSRRDYGVGSAVSVPIIVEDKLWGMVGTLTVGRSLPVGTEQRLEKFAALAATAIANAENKAGLRASRARVVATGDESRRRLQRDVHDGAQQWLVQTVLALQLGRDAAARGESPTDLIDEALRYAERATNELRGLVHGILPASLSRGGLRTGLESLIADIPTSVTLDVEVPKLTTAIETTAYFVVAEALTNVMKHARATHAHVTVGVDHDNGTLRIDIQDDGIGGADASRGTGLTGLTDRVQAAEGSLMVDSPVGGGTTLHAAIPLPKFETGHAGSVKPCEESDRTPRDPR